MSDKEYLKRMLELYRNEAKGKNISIRLIPSYFKINFDQLDNNKVQIFSNFKSELSIRVSKNINNWEAYTLILIGMTLIYQKNNTLIEPGKIIFDKDKQKSENLELCKIFATDLILGTNNLDDYEKIM